VWADGTGRVVVLRDFLSIARPLAGEKRGLFTTNVTSCVESQGASVTGGGPISLSLDSRPLYCSSEAHEFPNQLEAHL
jgi:hypothetical protein